MAQHHLGVGANPAKCKMPEKKMDLKMKPFCDF